MPSAQISIFHMSTKSYVVKGVFGFCFDSWKFNFHYCEGEGGGGSKVLYWAHFKGIKKNVFLDSAQAFLDSEGSLAASVIDNLKFVIKIHCH